MGINTFEGGLMNRSTKPDAKDQEQIDRVVADPEFQKDAKEMGLKPLELLEEASAGKDSMLDRANRVTALNRATMANKKRDQEDLKEVRDQLENLG